MASFLSSVSWRKLSWAVLPLRTSVNASALPGTSSINGNRSFPSINRNGLGCWNTPKLPDWISFWELSGCRSIPFSPTALRIKPLIPSCRPTEIPRPWPDPRRLPVCASLSVPAPVVHRPHAMGMETLLVPFYNDGKRKGGSCFMENQKQQLTDAAKIAQFRLSVIAPVIHGLYPDASRNAYYRRVTEKPLTLPDGSTFQYNPKTISKWVSLYQTGGIDALMPKERSDKGSTRVLPDTAIEEIYRLKEAFPRLNATQIHKQLVENSFIPATVNVCAVQRFIRNHDLKSARNPNMKDRKAFEEDAFGKMWQADTCYLPYITEDGKRRRVYCIMIIDDHSRLLVGGGLFYNDNAYNFQKVFKQAVAAYGIPMKLYVDNGCSYSNEQLSLICGSIGTVLLHTKIRDGASKAKIERQWRTLKESWLYTLDLDSIHSLEEFNRLLADYIRTYNTSFHSGIREIPLERYRRTCMQVRMPKSRSWLDECFMNRVVRRVNRDSTVSIDRISYDVPMQFIASKVEIRFLPDDMSSAYILYEGGHYPVRQTDRNENCRTKRNNTPALDYSRMGGGS